MHIIVTIERCFNTNEAKLEAHPYNVHMASSGPHASQNPGPGAFGGGAGRCTVSTIAVVVVTAVIVTVAGGASPCDGTVDTDWLHSLFEAQRVVSCTFRERRRSMRRAMFIAIKIVTAGMLRQEGLRNIMVDISPLDVCPRRCDVLWQINVGIVGALKDVTRKCSL